MRKINRVLTAALGCVFGALGNFALFGDEPVATTPSGARPTAVVSRPQKLEAPTGRKAFLVGADDYGGASDLTCVRNACPATRIDWAGAVAFARWLANESGTPIRLPTEAEWEYAARAYEVPTNRLHDYGFRLVVGR